MKSLTVATSLWLRIMKIIVLSFEQKVYLYTKTIMLSTLNFSFLWMTDASGCALIFLFLGYFLEHFQFDIQFL